jgi:hypothetical protein
VADRVSRPVVQSSAVSVVVGRVEVVAVAVTSVGRQVLNGFAQLATAVVGCMCAITSVTAVAECMCVAVAVEFTIVAIAGAAVAAHAYLMICRSRRQSCNYHIRMQSRVVSLPLTKL